MFHCPCSFFSKELPRVLRYRSRLFLHSLPGFPLPVDQLRLIVHHYGHSPGLFAQYGSSKGVLQRFSPVSFSLFFPFLHAVRGRFSRPLTETKVVPSDTGTGALSPELFFPGSLGVRAGLGFPGPIVICISPPGRADGLSGQFILIFRQRFSYGLSFCAIPDLPFEPFFPI